MYRLILGLAVLVTLGFASQDALAGHGRRVVRRHHGVYHHHRIPHRAVYRAPIVRYGHHHVGHQHVYHGPIVYPSYGHVVHHYGYAPAGFFYGGHGISIRIGY